MNANNYVHPANHPASVITQDAGNRFVTDVEKAAWNAKQPAGTYATGTGTASGTNTGDQTAITGNAGTATVLQTARTINGVSFNGSANITVNAVDATARVASASLGVANGVATLDGSGKVPAAQLPSFVDDVLEVANFAELPTTGEAGKIYVALDTNKTYRWSGSAYVYITSGAVDSVAGKTGVVTLVKADVGLGSVDNVAAAALRDRTTHTGEQAISTVTGLQTALDGKSATTHGHNRATTQFDGFMSGPDKLKLDGIAAGASAYAHPTSGVSVGTYRSVTVNAQGHVTAGANPTTLSGYGIQDAASMFHAHGTTTSTEPGFMTSAEQSKLNGIEANANKYTLPMSSDTVMGGVKVGQNLAIDAAGTLRCTLTPNFIQNDESTFSTRYITFVHATNGGISQFGVSSTKLTFNPSTGDLSATNFNSTSDANKKTNVRTVENALDLVCKMRGVRFNWLDTGIPGTGVIAQEMEAILPEVVSTSTEGDKSVSYGTIIGVLIEAIKEQQAMINQLMNK